MANSSATTKQHNPLPAYRRVVVKAGTNVLTSDGARLDRVAMTTLVGEVAHAHRAGAQVVLVTSGAVAAGREVLTKPNDAGGVGVEQMLAAVGQIRLMHAYQDMFGENGVVVAQALLTHADVEGRRGYLNVRNTLEMLLANGVVPIVNENDVVETEELSETRFGDNDTLSALVANIVDADLLLLLSDVGGLYTADPNRDAGAELIARVERVDADILAVAEEHRNRSTRGGMQSKLLAARRATAAGIDVVVARGHEPGVVARAVGREAVGTLFPATATRVESRKRWLLSGTAESSGVLVIDDGAVAAVRQQTGSLLPAGVRDVRGNFVRGDVVTVAEAGGERVAVGVVNYDAEEMRAIQGAKSSAIVGLLGHTYGAEAVHRNNMAVL